MKLKSLIVNRLFNQYSYNIDFKEDINIITSPNGYGKSTILRAISSLFDLNFYYFFQIPFEKIIFEFDNDYYISVAKNNTPSINDDSSDISGESDILIREQLFVSINDEKDIIIEKDDIESSFEKLGFIKFENDLWFDSKGEKYFSSLDIIIQNPSIIESLFKDKGELLMQLSGTNVLFIKDNRLFTSSFEKCFSDSLIHIEKYVIEDNANKLKNIITEKKREFSKKFQASQSKIIASITVSSNLNILVDEYNKRAKILNDKFGRAFSIGICEDIKIPVDFNDGNKVYLSITLQEYEKVIDEFIEFIEKIELFIDIITKSEFSNKKILVKAEYGYKFISDSGLFISNKSLSSGEQHRVITLFELIFNSNNGMLILFDEPELSNHVMWQLSFIGDMERVFNGKNIQSIIATHSPQIIDGRWNLTKDLYQISNDNNVSLT